MKKPLKVKAIPLEKLESLIQDENSCISLNRIQDHLVLHPYHLNDLQNSVKEILNKKIARYSPALDGILCGYKNINFLSDLGRIFYDAVFIHVDIEVDCFVFKPTPKKSLEAVVNKISTDHVGCLVHNLFNVSLPKPKHEQNWIGQSLSSKDKIVVEITSVNFDRKLPYICAEIKSAPEGHINESGKHKHFTEDGNEEFVSPEAESPKKKSKKRKHQEENEEFESSYESPKKKQKKKKHHEENEEFETSLMEELSESTELKPKGRKHQDGNEESESPRKRKKSKSVCVT